MWERQDVLQRRENRLLQRRVAERAQVADVRSTYCSLRGFIDLPVACRHGYGTMRYPSGSSYEGEWKEDKKSGKGAMIWKDVDEVYTGQPQFLRLLSSSSKLLFCIRSFRRMGK